VRAVGRRGWAAQTRDFLAPRGIWVETRRVEGGGVFSVSWGLYLGALWWGRPAFRGGGVGGVDRGGWWGWGGDSGVCGLSGGLPCAVVRTKPKKKKIPTPPKTPPKNNTQQKKTTTRAPPHPNQNPNKKHPFCLYCLSPRPGQPFKVVGAALRIGRSDAISAYPLF